jgi:hypothetical protein
MNMLLVLKLKLLQVAAVNCSMKRSTKLRYRSALMTEQNLCTNMRIRLFTLSITAKIHLVGIRSSQASVSGEGKSVLHREGKPLVKNLLTYFLTMIDDRRSMISLQPYFQIKAKPEVVTKVKHYWQFFTLCIS